jgi:hypothetical protein
MDRLCRAKGNGKVPSRSKRNRDADRRSVRPCVAAMWGYAQGNETIVGIVVVIIGAAAIGYVARRLWRRGR